MLGLVATAGCDVVFGLDHVPPLPPVVDAAIPPPDALLCQPSVIHDDFTATAVCDDWGNPTDPTNTTEAEGGGMLVVTLAPGAASQGGCIARSPMAFDAAGIFIKIPVVPQQQGGSGSGGAFLFFRTTEPTPAGAATLQISLGGGSIEVSQGGASLVTVPYVPADMQWWRIRPDAGAVVAEVSGGGLAWQTLAMAAGTLPTSVGLEFTAGEFGNGLSDPGMAVFEDFNICP